MKLYQSIAVAFFRWTKLPLDVEFSTPDTARMVPSSRRVRAACRKTLVGSAAALALFVIGARAQPVAPAAPPKAEAAFVPSLIPLPRSALAARWKTARAAFGSRSALGAVREDVGNHPVEGVGHLLYSASADAGRFSISLDAMTGDVTLWRKQELEMTQSQEQRAQHELSDEQLIQRAKGLLAQFYPSPSVLNVVRLEKGHVHASELQPDGTFKDSDPLSDSVTVFFTSVAPNGAVLPNRCILEMRADTGELVGVQDADYRAQTVSPIPTLKREDALAIARYRITKGEPVPIALTLYKDYNAAQQAYDGMYKAYKDEPELFLEQDEWLHQRLVWKFYFNVGTYIMDAHTGEYVGSDSTIITVPRNVEGDGGKLFALPQPAALPRPANLPPDSVPVETARVSFNEDGPRPETDLAKYLHYPPIIRDGTPLICADYFPHFLIETQVQGPNITLSSRLTGKLQTAQLRVGARTMTLNDTTLGLPTAPVVVNGHLYLPASLLQTVGGVPVRWNPLYRWLFVTTQTLRRPTGK